MSSRLAAGSLATLPVGSWRIAALASLCACKDRCRLPVFTSICQATMIYRLFSLPAEVYTNPLQLPGCHPSISFSNNCILLPGSKCLDVHSTDQAARASVPGQHAAAAATPASPGAHARAPARGKIFRWLAQVGLGMYTRCTG